MWANARLVERLEFAHRFLGGPAEPAIRAVAAYQNADGGFGQALESDLRAPTSQPVPVEIALRKLEGLAALKDPMVGEAMAWLASVARPDGGVPFVLATADGFPNAPWWQAAPGEPSSLNPTGALVGLLRTAGAEGPWLDRAEAWCWSTVDSWDGTDPYTARSVLTFLERVGDRVRAEDALARVGALMVATGTVRPPTDGAAIGGMGTVLGFAPEPSSGLRPFLPSGWVDQALDALTGQQKEDGRWEADWEAPSAAAQLEAAGVLTLEALTILRANGRL